MESSSSTTIRRGRESLWQTNLNSVNPNGCNGLSMALQLNKLFYKNFVLTGRYTYCICLPGLIARISHATLASAFFLQKARHNSNPNPNPQPIPNVQKFH